MPWKTGFEGGNTWGRSSEWMPSAPTTTSASAAVPFGELHAGDVGSLLEADRAVAGADDAGGKVRGEKFDVVGAVHAEAGVPSCGVGDLYRRDRRAVVAEIRGFQADTGAPALDRAAEPDALEVTYRVRRDIDAGADLADRRGLLVDGDAQPAREQRVGREQAADAAADYRYAGPGSHARIVQFRAGPATLFRRLHQADALEFRHAPAPVLTDPARLELRGDLVSAERTRIEAFRARPWHDREPR